MQLNPARGRKLGIKVVTAVLTSWVYAAQPREGTETVQSSNHEYEHV